MTTVRAFVRLEEREILEAIVAYLKARSPLLGYVNNIVLSWEYGAGNESKSFRAEAEVEFSDPAERESLFANVAGESDKMGPQR